VKLFDSFKTIVSPPIVACSGSITIVDSNEVNLTRVYRFNDTAHFLLISLKVDLFCYITVCGN
jgi:hypothetical protein